MTAEHTNHLGSRSGLTLIEVMISLAVLGLLFGGLITCGLTALRMAEYLRVSTEARAVGKEALESMVAAGRDTLGQSGFTVLHPTTNYSSLDQPLVRTVRLVWHNADGSAASASSNAYVEAHVDVSFYSPINKLSKVTTISGLIH